MSKWTKKKIKDFAFTASGGTPSTERKDYWHNGTIPWINSGELSKNDVIKKPTAYITQEALENSSAKLFPVGTVVIALTGATTGMSAILEIETSTNQSITGIFPSKEHDSRFLLYTLHHNIDKILLHNVGSAQPHINKEIVDNLEFNFPEVPEQTKIARILSTCDAVIEKTQAAIAKYKAIKQGMLQDLFTRGIDLQTGKLRPRYQDAPHLYKESKLGMIPREWEVKVLDEITNQIVDGTHFTPTYTDYGIPFLRVTDVQVNKIDLTQVKFISEEEHIELKKRCNPQRGDILYSKNGTIGIPKIVDWDWEFSIFVSLCLIKPKQASISSNYLETLLSQDIIYKQIQIRAKQGTVTNLHLEEIREFVIPLPELKEQIEITKRVQAIDNKLQTEQSYLQKMQSIKKGLMEDLLSGKKRLNCDLCD